MTAREAIALLESEGFVSKGGAKHDQYEKNGVKIGVPRGAGDLSRTVAANIKRAIKKARGE